MPNWECSWAWSVARGSGVTVLAELLGDWETGTLYSSRRMPLYARRLMARWARHRTERIIAGADVLVFKNGSRSDRCARRRRR